MDSSQYYTLWTSELIICLNNVAKNQWFDKFSMLKQVKKGLYHMAKAVGGKNDPCPFHFKTYDYICLDR